MENITNALRVALEKLYGQEVAGIDIILTVAPAETGADYASNLAMQLASRVHQAPRAVGEAIMGELANQADEFTVEIAGPGFLNFRLNDRYFANKVARQAQGEIDFSLDDYRDKMVVAEFSDPNPFKVLHVGHLYTSVVGDAISRLLELAGAKVVRANFGGDVGLHVAKNLWAVQQRGVSLDDLTMEILAECYVEGTRAYEDDEQAKAEITALNKEIYQINEQDLHDSELAKLYWKGRELSYKYFEDFYAKIGLKFDKFYPESSVAGRGLQEVREHVGTVYEESDGAIVYKGEKVGLHTRVFINREGVPTYEAKDVGLIFTKWDDWHFDESVVITGNEQTDYMKVVLASVHEYAPELVDRTTHLTHGMVRLPGNQKMSSRKGNFLRAVDVIEIVKQKASSLAGRRPVNTSYEELSEAAAESVGCVSPVKTGADDTRSEKEVFTGRRPVDALVLAAIKYAFLKYRVGGDIIFDPAESVAISGNSGIYIIYSLVRAGKILQKVNNVGELQDFADEHERKLAKKLVGYNEILAQAVLEKAPSKVCGYLFELAQEFSRFYEHEQVAGHTREVERAVLVQAFVMVLKHGLRLLGIEQIPEDM